MKIAVIPLGLTPFVPFRTCSSRPATATQSTVCSLRSIARESPASLERGRDAPPPVSLARVKFSFPRLLCRPPSISPSYHLYEGVGAFVSCPTPVQAFPGPLRKKGGAGDGLESHPDARAGGEQAWLQPPVGFNLKSLKSNHSSAAPLFGSPFGWWGSSSQGTASLCWGKPAASIQRMPTTR